jgi:hypothetical protein
VVGLAGVAATLVAAVISARSRLRQAIGEERVQMLWFAWAALSSPAALVVCWLVCWLDYWWTGPAASDDRTGPALTRAVAGSVRVW